MNLLYREEYNKKKKAARMGLLFFISFFALAGLMSAVQIFLSRPLLENATASASSALSSVQVQEVIQETLSLSIPDKIRLGISAESALSVAINDNQETVLFKKDLNQKLSIASLTKLMTALIVLENYDLGQKVVVSKSAMKQIGEQGSLKEGEVLSVKDLLYISLIESSNRAAYALSEVVRTEIFIKMMNEKAQVMGLSNTNFVDSTGLDAKSYSTVKDLAVLSEHLFENYPLFREIISTKEFNLYLDGTFHHKLINTNKMLSKGDIIGGKTGWTQEAQGCVMVISKNMQSESYIIHIILGAQDRFLEMQKLISFSK